LKATHNDARYPGNASIQYPLHPCYGQDLLIARRFGAGTVQQFELQAADRRVLVPVWMLDLDRCRQMTRGDEPRCSLTSLLQLVALLRSTDL
jgi:hypothetical protein